MLLFSVILNDCQHVVVSGVSVQPPAVRTDKKKEKINSIFSSNECIMMYINWTMINMTERKRQKKKTNKQIVIKRTRMLYMNRIVPTDVSCVSLK